MSKPIEVKRIKGTANSTRERRKAEIVIPGEHNELTPAPIYFNPKVKGIWDKIVKHLSGLGLNYPTVYEYIVNYCQLYEMREETIKDMAKNGIYITEGKTKNPSGINRKSVAYKAYHQLTKQMMMIGSKLGLTPEDISKIS